MCSPAREGVLPNPRECEMPRLRSHRLSAFHPEGMAESSRWQAKRRHRVTSRYRECAPEGRRRCRASGGSGAPRAPASPQVAKASRLRRTAQLARTARNGQGGTPCLQPPSRIGGHTRSMKYLRRGGPSSHVGPAARERYAHGLASSPRRCRPFSLAANRMNAAAAPNATPLTPSSKSCH